MRAIGLLHPTDNAVFPSDQVTTLLMAGAGAGQSGDWLSSASTVANNAAAAMVHLARITALTTAGAGATAYVNLFTTAAAVPTSGTSASSAGGGSNIPVFGSRDFQIPGGSTGYSVAAPSSCIVHIEQWERA